MKAKDIRFQVHQDVIFTEVEGDESVLLHLGTGIYYGLDEVGTALWKLLEQGKTNKEITVHLLSEYEVSEAQLRQDLQQIISELQQENLICFG